MLITDMSVQHVVTYPPPHHNIFICMLFSLHVYAILTVQDGRSPLFMPSKYGHTDIVDLLLKAGADVHQTDKVLPLHVLLNLTAREVTNILL